jgi:hypothetical protein
MAKKKAAKKKARTSPAAVRARVEASTAVEDARIAFEKEQQALRDAMKGIVREVLDDERKELLNHAQERFSEMVREQRHVGADHVLTLERGGIPTPGPGPLGAGMALRAPESSNVSVHIDELAAAMAKLGETINLLEDRLEPVMRGGTATDGGPTDPKVALPVNCQVSGRVYDLTNRAAAFRARVDDLMFRLQV